MSTPNGQLTFSREEASDTTQRIQRLKVADLKQLAKHLGLLLKGNKSDIQQRVFQFISEGHDTHDMARLLTVRAIVLKVCQGVAPPPYAVLYNNLVRGHPGAQPTLNTVKINSISGPRSTPGGRAFSFKETPFYSNFVPISKTPYVAKPGYSKESKETLVFSFLLTESETYYLSKDPKRKLFLFCSTAQNNGFLQYPSQVEISCNGQVLKGNYKGLKNKLGTASPAELSAHVTNPRKPSNIIMHYIGAVEPYYLFVSLATVKTSEELLQVVRSRPHIHPNSTISDIKKEYEPTEDDDIVMANTTMSLRCPLTYMRMKYPAKGLYCQHVQCFDALSFLMSQESIPAWSCPICQNHIRFEELAISDYMLQVLDKTDSEIENITLNSDGSWRPLTDSGAGATYRPHVTPTKPPSREKSPVSEPPSEDIIEILDSDDEEEQGPVNNPAHEEATSENNINDILNRDAAQLEADIQNQSDDDVPDDVPISFIRNHPRRISLEEDSDATPPPPPPPAPSSQPPQLPEDDDVPLRRLESDAMDEDRQPEPVQSHETESERPRTEPMEQGTLVVQPDAPVEDTEQASSNEPLTQDTQNQEQTTEEQSVAEQTTELASNIQEAPFEDYAMDEDVTETGARSDFNTTPQVSDEVQTSENTNQNHNSPGLTAEALTTAPTPVMSVAALVTQLAPIPDSTPQPAPVAGHILPEPVTESTTEPVPASTTTPSVSPAPVVPLVPAPEAVPVPYSRPAAVPHQYSQSMLSLNVAPLMNGVSPDDNLHRRSSFGPNGLTGIRRESTGVSFAARSQPRYRVTSSTAPTNLLSSRITETTNSSPPSQSLKSTQNALSQNIIKIIEREFQEYESLVKLQDGFSSFYRQFKNALDAKFSRLGYISKLDKSLGIINEPLVHERIVPFAQQAEKYIQEITQHQDQWDPTVKNLSLMLNTLTNDMQKFETLRQELKQNGSRPEVTSASATSSPRPQQAGFSEVVLAPSSSYSPYASLNRPGQVDGVDSYQHASNGTQYSPNVYQDFRLRPSNASESSVQGQSQRENLRGGRNMDEERQQTQDNIRKENEHIEFERRQAGLREEEKSESERREPERRDAETRKAYEVAVRENQRHEAQRREYERFQYQQQAAERQAAEKREQERQAAIHRETQIRETLRLGAQRRADERHAAAQREAQRRVAEIYRQEAQIRARQEAERQEAEKRKEAERRDSERKEAESRENERIEAERKEAEKRAAENREAARKVTERRNSLEKQRRESEPRQKADQTHHKSAETNNLQNSQDSSRDNLYEIQQLRTLERLHSDLSRRVDECRAQIAKGNTSIYSQQIERDTVVRLQQVRNEIAKLRTKSVNTNAAGNKQLPFSLALKEQERRRQDSIKRKENISHAFKNSEDDNADRAEDRNKSNGVPNASQHVPVAPLSRLPNSDAAQPEKSTLPVRYSQSAFDLMRNSLKEASKQDDNTSEKNIDDKVKGMLGIELSGRVINVGGSSMSISPLNSKISDMSIQTPNGKKRVLSDNERVWNKRMSNEDGTTTEVSTLDAQGAQVERSPGAIKENKEPQANTGKESEIWRRSSYSRFDPNEFNTNEVVYLDG